MLPTSHVASRRLICQSVVRSSNTPRFDLLRLPATGDVLIVLVPDTSFMQMPANACLVDQLVISFAAETDQYDQWNSAHGFQYQTHCCP